MFDKILSLRTTVTTPDNVTPRVVLDISIPSETGGLLYAEFVVLGRSATDFRLWRRAALLERSSGGWTVLGAPFDLPTPAGSAGASSWTVAPSTPGLNGLRLTVTGGPATWFALVEALRLT
jgi:hypothetical protein